MRVLPGLLGLLVVAAAAPAQPTPRELLDAYERHLKALHETAGPAMACVVVSRSDQYPKPATPPDYPGRLGGFDAGAFGKAGKAQAALARRLDLTDPRDIPDHESAAGVVIDPAGLVLTTQHTVEGATKVYVHLPGGKGSYADVYAADGRSDLAVLKLLTPPAGLKAVKLADVRLHALPAAAPTVTPGKLIAVMAFQPATGFAPDRPGAIVPAVTNVLFPAWNPNSNDTPQSVYRYGPLLEFEARSAPAVSGAAVLNLDGELVGLTSTIAAVAGGDGGRAYALPADANFRRIVGVLARGEEVEYGFLGIVIGRGAVNGVEISQVAPRSPAERELVPGDTIVRINGQPTRNYPDLLYQIGSTLAGNKATMRIRGREGGDRTVELTVAKYKHDSPSVAANRPAPVFGLRVDWSSVLAQSAGTAVPPGVVVRETVPDSPAAAKFKDLGDNTRWLVTHVNGAPTPTPAAFYQAARNQASVRLTVVDAADRGGRSTTVVLP